VGVDLWFPTPIYSATLAGRRWRPALVREIHRLHEGRHVRHGAMSERGFSSYHTQNMLQRTRSLRPFYRAVLRHAYAFARALHADTTRFAIVVASSWANVYPGGEYVRPHSHPNCHLSGVFYVAAEPGHGDLVFYNPLEYHKSSDIPQYRKASAVSYEYVPYPVETGRLVIFPNWLKHATLPNSGSANRIIVSFNFRFVPTTSAGRSTTTRRAEPWRRRRPRSAARPRAGRSRARRA
jgi:uncharacterized protein (TIGR02466 family)